ncbi:restriction endonuclease subunit S [Acinetobacter sp. YH12233]|uniref:restriction endonuclease subunit S n=1 Tax=Acinetobacter sp. YH12233 TaxID=2601161 RepID=UPI0015D45DC3
MSSDKKLLSDFATVISGYAFKSEWFGTGNDKVIRIGDLQEGSIQTEAALTVDASQYKISDNFKIQNKDILMALSGATVGKIAVASDADVGSYINQRVAIIRAKDEITADYLKFFFSGEFLDGLLKNAGGAAQPNLSPKQLLLMEIPFPRLAEQRRIATILDQADELRQKRQQAIEKLDQLLQATFIDMFGDPEQNPKKWNKVILGDICDAKDRVNYGVVQPGNDFEGGIPLIRVGDIDGGILSFTSIKTIDPEIEKDYSRSRLKGNEILVSCVGSIGTIAKVPNKAIGFNIARAITRVPLQDKRIINFVAECLKTEAIQNYFKKNTRTVSQPTLNVSFVKETEIIFPNEEKILDFCKIVDKVEFQKELLQKALVMQESLFQSLQNQAFNGSL